MSEQIRVFMADDHPVVREGLRRILEEEEDIVVIGEASDGVEVLQRSRELPWDVLLLDIGLPGRNGLDVLKQLKAEAPARPILVLSMHAEEQYATRVYRSGGDGYLTKESAPDTLVHAIRRVHQGGKYVSETFSEQLVGMLGPGEGATSQPGELHEQLTDREFQVFKLIAGGQTPKEVSEGLNLSIKTVSTHRRNVLDKLGLETTADIIRYAIQAGIVEDSL